MKARVLTMAMLLITAATCMAQQNKLEFQTVVYKDSLYRTVKLMDYSGDQEPTYAIGKAREDYSVSTLKVVGGPAEAMEFLNQWLIIDAAEGAMDGPVNTKTVKQKFNEVKAKPEFAGKPLDINTVLRVKASQFLSPDDPDNPEEAWGEIGNQIFASVIVNTNTPNYVTLYSDGYDYPSGAAHGMPWSIYFTFDLKNKRLLTLDDIFTKAGKSKVLQMVKKELRDEYSEFGLSSEIGFPGNAPALTEKGVVFTYGAYEIGPYAMGMPEVCLPYSKVKQYMTPQAKALLK